jgi:UDP-N-acetylmuramoylalanine--D-glutamate ligase
MNKIIVYGLGISGISTAKALNEKNFQIFATDDSREAIEVNAQKYPNINFKNLEQISFDKDTVISFAPGIPLYFPKPHKILEICQKTQAKLACDIEIFYELNHKNNDFIGITGTNGKSTTTALTGYIFEKLAIASKIGGNIGIACFELPQDQTNFNYILEVSSYQLDLITNTRFNIACLLNITPDHIDRHGSFENYIASKKRIFLNQTSQDFAIVDIDNSNSLKVFEDLQNNKNFNANLVAISTKQIPQNGVAIIDKKVFVNLQNQSFEFEINPILKGQHNHQNIACALAITCCNLIKKSQFTQLKIGQIIKIIEDFKGLKHRMQLIRKIDEISFINDSKATNAESTENALKAYENIFWIVGGKAKEGGIDSLEPYFSKVKKAYLIGEASDEFAKILEKNSVNYEKCQTLKNAFDKSLIDTKSSNLIEKNIILSPACASFDQWKNFEERGDFFCKLVNDI